MISMYSIHKTLPVVLYNGLIKFIKKKKNVRITKTQFRYAMLLSSPSVFT